MSSVSVNQPLPPLTGGSLTLAALMLASANFIVVLDMTIANVSVSTIAGGLGISNNEGTYVITSYSVAEAISVPLTGWLANRFGTVRSFFMAVILFGIFSGLCGLANSLNSLVFFRVLQGLTGGPMMPLSQTLLMQIFPPENKNVAIGLWAMTTLIAPVMGPILGGIICDSYSWPYIFLINIPIALIAGGFGWVLLKQYETICVKEPIDIGGLILLIIWVGALQIMLDEGKNQDWFNSNEIITLAVISLIAFLSFIIWEITHDNPIVNLRVFRHRGYSASVITLSLAFGSFFAANVLTPLWLQNYMGYTATWAGYVTAASGVSALIFSPLVASVLNKIDARQLVFFGIMVLAMVSLFRSGSTTDMTAWQVALPLLFMGIGLPFFFMPLTNLGLASVDFQELASAAGLMNFMRTLSGAMATSIVTTSWENTATYYHAELSGLVDRSGESMNALTNAGMPLEQARGVIDQLVQSQSIMLSTNYLFFIAGLSFSLAAFTIWIAPTTKKTLDTTHIH